MYKGYIYKWENKINSRVYIGQTMNRYGYKERWKQHIYQAEHNVHNNKFHNAIRKYGVDNFNKEVLKCIEMNDKAELKKTLDILEIKYIEKYDSLNNGYNSTLGGDFNLWNSSEESEKDKYRMKMIEAKNKSQKWKDWVDKHRKEVVKINTEDYSLIERYESCIEAARLNGMEASHVIRSRCRGEFSTGKFKRKSNLFEDNISFMYLEDYVEGLTVNQVAEKYGVINKVDEVFYGIDLTYIENLKLMDNKCYIDEIDYSKKEITKILLFYAFNDNCPLEVKIDIYNVLNKIKLNDNEQIVINEIMNYGDMINLQKVLNEKYKIKKRNVGSIIHRLNKKIYNNIND